MSRKPRVLQLWLSVIGVSGVVSIYAVGERWSTDTWAGLWMQLAFFGGVMAWVGWLFGRVYEQELSEAVQPMTEDERNRRTHASHAPSLASRSRLGGDCRSRSPLLGALVWRGPLRRGFWLGYLFCRVYCL